MQGLDQYGAFADNALPLMRKERSYTARGFCISRSAVFTLLIATGSENVREKGVLNAFFGGLT